MHSLFDLILLLVAMDDCVFFPNSFLFPFPTSYMYELLQLSGPAPTCRETFTSLFPIFFFPVNIAYIVAIIMSIFPFSHPQRSSMF